MGGVLYNRVYITCKTEKRLERDGRYSIRFTKTLSNGVVVVVEKENLKDDTVGETINMWADATNVTNTKHISPDATSDNVIISEADTAKIINDATAAIVKDVKSSQVSAIQNESTQRMSSFTQPSLHNM